jgi:phosphate transport system substrate-binding protein
VIIHRATHRLTLSLVLGMLLIACGSTPTPSAPATAAPVATLGQLPEVEPATMEGAIHIVGSSTVYPVTEAVVEALQTAGAPTRISVESVGTGAGFQRFCAADPADEIDIVDASRPITAKEQAQCEARGRVPLGFQIGMDALAVVVHKDNAFVEALSFAQLAQIFSGQAKTWADVDSRYPNEPIALFSPGTDSGTFDYFVEAIFAGEQARMASSAALSEDDIVLVNGVASHPYAIGYFGFAYYQENANRLKVLKIDGGTGRAIVPAAETAADGSYPLARPLSIYSTAAIMQQKPQVAAFINYYLQHADEAVAEVGYFPTAPSARDEARQTFLQATGLDT